MIVTIVVPERVRDADSPTAVSPRAFHRVDQFAEEVSKALSLEVPVFEGPLGNAPTSGFLLAFDLRSDDDLSQGPRLVSVADDRSTVIQRLERHHLVAGIEKTQYWQYMSKHDAGFGVIGRRDVAQRMGAKIMTTGPYASVHYAAIASEPPHPLPELLASYLCAYAQTNSQ
ncbi:MAG TPA: hypothetical protein VG871_22620 [Vicinamibacterales bacterium]|nr:hypothetical protein [Vicinamibacterales bacterium]